jgi:hypothetical protein
MPRVNPAGEGSIDLHWRSAARELLVNIPKDVDLPCTFFGRSFSSRDTLTGKLDQATSRQDMTSWLIEWDPPPGQ